MNVRSPAGGTRRGLLPPLLVLALFLAGCSSVRVRSDWDGEIDFSRYQTFAFAPSPTEPRGAPAPGNRAFLDKRIKRAVADDLAAKGLVLREEGAPDLIVAYYLKLQDVVHVYTYGRYPRRWGGATTVDRHREGTLVLDLVDRRRDEIVWRGWGERIPADVQDSDRKIRDAVAKILASFPPP